MTKTSPEQETKNNQDSADSAMEDTPETGFETLVRSDPENPDAEHALYLLIGGAHCANCIQKIESAVKKNPSVKTARLNFSTGRLTIEWNGDMTLANNFAADIRKLGYSVSPYQQNAAARAEEDENKFLLLCLGVAGFAMGNIMLLSVGLWVSNTQSMGFVTRELMHWVSALIAIPAILFSGRPFFRSAWKALKGRTTNMDVPISVALILTTAMSLFETIRGSEHAYFDSAVMLMFFLLIGRYLDFRARRTAKTAASDLMQTLSGFATVKDGDKTKRIAIRDVEENMEVIIAAGEKLPVDGIIINGSTTLDTSLITGETLPVEAGKGDKIFSGTLNLGEPVTIKVLSTAEDSLLSDIVRLIEKAEQGQARYVRLADKAAKLYTPLVHSLALLAFILWFGLWGASWQDSLTVAITVLIITCPCALGLAVPVVQVLAAGVLMKRNVLIKSGDALERLAAIDTAVFDKTGTLTTGHLTLSGDHNKADLQIAASLAAMSHHPLSKAVYNAYDGDLLTPEDITEHRGKGIEARINGKTVKLGSRHWCGDQNAAPSENIELWLRIENHDPVLFTFTDIIRTDTAATIAHLQKEHIDTVLLSGDRQTVADAVANATGIKSVYAEKKPDEKFAIMDDLHKQHRKAMMVGDGLNDAPVLSHAYVSMAPGTAVDMAQNAADIIFMGDKLAPVHETYMTARQTQTLVKQNFALAVLYNIIAVPAAFAGLITPMIAALAMSGSSIMVIANSFRLKIPRKEK